jgi:hypothetical protein
MAFPPLQSPLAAADKLSVLAFSISPLPPFATRMGTLFIVGLGQDEAKGTKIDGIRATRRKQACPMRPRNLTAWELPVCSLLGSWSPSLYYSILLKNSKLCSLTLPFLESRSSRKFQNSKKDIFSKKQS